jgi:hypothetical protein
MKKKYNVYGIMTASIFIGEYEAESQEEAEDMANRDSNANWMPSLCHQCSNEIDLGDVYKTEVEEV